MVKPVPPRHLSIVGGVGAVLLAAGVFGLAGGVPLGSVAVVVGGGLVLLGVLLVVAWLVSRRV